MTLNELKEGLQKFQDAAGIEEDARAKAFALLNFDQDFDQSLGPNEFAAAMVHYARTFTIDLHELIDFISVSTVLGSNAHGFQTAYGKALVSKDAPKTPHARHLLVQDIVSVTEDETWSDDPFFDT